MTELEKYRLVNSCENLEALELVIMSFADEEGMIEGRTKRFNARNMIMGLKEYISGEFPARVITRNWGLRQQAMYLKYYENIDVTGTAVIRPYNSKPNEKGKGNPKSE